MNEISQIAGLDAEIKSRISNGYNPQFVAYMRGGAVPPSGSVPRSTSPFLNSALFRSAFTTMSLRRMGSDIPCTYDIPDMSRGLEDVMDYAYAQELVEAEKVKNPEFAAWLDARTPIQFDMDALAGCREGTFGNAIHDFVVNSGMEIFFVNPAEIRTDIEFVMTSNGKSHDLQHMLSGFGPNMAGEHALSMMNITSMNKYFTPELATFLNMANNFVASAFFARTFFNYPGGTEVTLEATQRGIEAGRAAERPLFMTDWNKYLDWKMVDAAADLGFRMGPGKEWDFSEECCQG